MGRYLLIVAALLMLSSRAWGTCVAIPDVSGQINVRTCGAKCDGTTDDTVAVQSAVNAAESTTPPKSILIPWTGHNCVVSQLNLTNLVKGFRIIGQNAPKSNQVTTTPNISGFLCNEASSNTGVCIDTSGSWYWSLENLSILPGTNSPNISLLLAKTTAAGGNSQAGSLLNDDIYNNGPYTIYNYGGEVLKVDNTAIGGGATATLVISAANTAGITSPFTTLGTAPQSMTVGDYDDDVFSIPSGSAGILFDVGSGSPGLIGSQKFDGGYINQQALGAFNATGSTTAYGLYGLTIDNMRDEAFAGASGYFFKSAVQVENFEFKNDTFVEASAPSVSTIQFNEASVVSAASGYINIRPGDAQSQYPSAPVVSCANGAEGVVFNSIDALGGVPLASSCLGILTAYKGGVRDLNQYSGSGSNVIPACGSTIRNGELWVSDGATGCPYGSAYSAAAGAAVCKVGCNGSSWLYGF